MPFYPFNKLYIGLYSYILVEKTHAPKEIKVYNQVSAPIRMSSLTESLPVTLYVVAIPLGSGGTTTEKLGKAC